MVDTTTDKTKNSGHNSKRKSFFDLPPELRNNIYQLITDSVDSSVVMTTTKKATSTYRHVTSISRKFNNEFLPVFHKEGQLLVSPSPHSHSHVWLERFGESSVPLIGEFQINDNSIKWGYMVKLADPPGRHRIGKGWSHFAWGGYMDIGDFALEEAEKLEDRVDAILAEGKQWREDGTAFITVDVLKRIMETVIVSKDKIEDHLWDI